MSKSPTLEHILHQVKYLDFADRLNLIERLLQLLKKENIKKNYELTDLNGLGSEIWTGITVDKYVQEQREWD